MTVKYLVYASGGVVTIEKNKRGRSTHSRPTNTDYFTNLKDAQKYGRTLKRNFNCKEMRFV